MRVIIPMAGMGKRLRPFTLQTPKPLVKVTGKTIVEHLLNNIKSVSNEPISEINYIIGKFSDEIKNQITSIAEQIGIKYNILVQDVPLGTAHAVYMAKEQLKGKVIIAFADTIFISDKKIDTNADAVIFTKQVNNPQQYGVVKFDENKERITAFVEKPQEFISDQAIIGIYYFKNAELLREKIEYLIENNITVKGEYQLTDALELLLKDGLTFRSLETKFWLDCGNPQMLLQTTEKILDLYYKQNTYPTEEIVNSVIIPPVYIGKETKIKNSIIGPYVSIESKVEIENSIIKNSIIYDNSKIKDISLIKSVIGHNTEISDSPQRLVIGDYSKISGNE